MTQTFFLGQLRLALVAIIAYAGGKGWLTPTDAGLATAMLTSLGPLIGPWAWSIYANINSKLVPSHAMVIDPINTVANADKPMAVVQTAAGSVTGKVVGALLIGLLVLSFLFRPDPAMAQTKSRGPQFTGDVVADIKANTAQAKSAVTGQPIADPRPVDVWKAIMTAALPDLVYSSALSSSAGTPASKIRKQCWDALIAANKQAQGTDLKDDQGNPLAKPDPHFFTDVELLAETIDNLSPTGPLFTSCAGAAEMARMSVLQFINAAVTGAAGFAMLGL